MRKLNHCTIVLGIPAVVWETDRGDWVAETAMLGGCMGHGDDREGAATSLRQMLLARLDGSRARGMTQQ